MLLRRVGEREGLESSVCLVQVGGPEEIDENDWDQLMAVNAKGLYLLSKFCLPYMVRGGGGTSRVMADGGIFEKAGVGFSHVFGDEMPPSATKNRPELAGKAFQAVGVSLVLHPHNPYVPTTHANFRFFSAGEYVRESAIVKLAQIDPLRVEVYAPLSLFGKLEAGMTGRVRPEDPVGGEYEARIVAVDRLVDAASGTFGVRLELPNPDYAIPAGLKCRVRF